MTPEEILAQQETPEEQPTQPLSNKELINAKIQEVLAAKMAPKEPTTIDPRVVEYLEKQKEVNNMNRMLDGVHQGLSQGTGIAHVPRGPADQTNAKLAKILQDKMAAKGQGDSELVRLLGMQQRGEIAEGYQKNAQNKLEETKKQNEASNKLRADEAKLKRDKFKTPSEKTMKELANTDQLGADLEDGIGFLDRYINQTKDDLLPATGWAKDFQQWGKEKLAGVGIGEGKDPGYQNVMDKVVTVTASRIKEISGTAASEGERAFLQGSLPTADDSPQLMRAKLVRVQAWQQERMRRVREYLTAGNKDLSQLTTADLQKIEDGIGRDIDSKFPLTNDTYYKDVKKEDGKIPTPGAETKSGKPEDMSDDDWDELQALRKEDK